MFLPQGQGQPTLYRRGLAQYEAGWPVVGFASISEVNLSMSVAIHSSNINVSKDFGLAFGPAYLQGYCLFRLMQLV